jgi:hypothetical protein
VRRTSLVVCLSLGAAACGASGTYDVTSPILACRSFVTAECTRLSQCEPDQAIDISSCTQLLEAKDICDATTCGTSTYSPSNAQTCLNDLLNQSCQDSENNVSPPSCAVNLLCIPPA